MLEVALSFSNGFPTRNKSPSSKWFVVSLEWLPQSALKIKLFIFQLPCFSSFKNWLVVAKKIFPFKTQSHQFLENSGIRVGIWGKEDLCIYIMCLYKKGNTLHISSSKPHVRDFLVVGNKLWMSVVFQTVVALFPFPHDTKQAPGSCLSYSTMTDLGALFMWPQFFPETGLLWTGFLQSSSLPTERLPEADTKCLEMWAISAVSRAPSPASQAWSTAIEWFFILFLLPGPPLSSLSLPSSCLLLFHPSFPSLLLPSPNRDGQGAEWEPLEHSILPLSSPSWDKCS